MWFRSETSKVRSRRAAEDTPELYGSSFAGLACRNASKMRSRCPGLISEVWPETFKMGSRKAAEALSEPSEVSQPETSQNEDSLSPTALHVGGLAARSFQNEEP